MNLAHIQFPPTNLQGQELQCQGAWVSEHSKSAPPGASGMILGRYLTSYDCFHMYENSHRGPELPQGLNKTSGSVPSAR